MAGMSGCGHAAPSWRPDKPKGMGEGSAGFVMQVASRVTGETKQLAVCIADW